MGLILKTRKPVSLCVMYDAKGKETSRIQLSEAVHAAAAVIHGGKLFVSDNLTKTVKAFNLADGKSVATIGEDVRVSYGIFGFVLDRRTGDVLIANSDASRVDRYSADGEPLSSFGQTGEGREKSKPRFDPTNLIVLPDGRLLVAEKGPTRLKIFTRWPEV